MSHHIDPTGIIYAGHGDARRQSEPGETPDITRARQHLERYIDSHNILRRPLPDAETRQRANALLDAVERECVEEDRRVITTMQSSGDLTAEIARQFDDATKARECFGEPDEIGDEVRRDWDEGPINEHDAGGEA